MRGLGGSWGALGAILAHVGPKTQQNIESASEGGPNASPVREPFFGLWRPSALHGRSRRGEVGTRWPHVGSRWFKLAQDGLSWEQEVTNLELTCPLLSPKTPKPRFRIMFDKNLECISALLSATVPSSCRGAFLRFAILLPRPCGSQVGLTVLFFISVIFNSIFS